MGSLTFKWSDRPAGAGKSAIAQSIAEMCHARHLLLASFFFSRRDPKRNNEKCLIASIAYQIALIAPVTRDAIEAAVETPQYFNVRSKHSSRRSSLILLPSSLRQSTPVPNLILIDGLDECSDHRVQQDILHTISIALQQPDLPMKFLICNRAESHLTLEFTSLTSEGMVRRLFLDDGYEQDADIERYLLVKAQGLEELLERLVDGTERMGAALERMVKRMWEKEESERKEKEKVDEVVETEEQEEVQSQAQVHPSRSSLHLLATLSWYSDFTPVFCTAAFEDSQRFFFRTFFSRQHILRPPSW